MNNVEINKQAKLSEHMTLGELTKTKHVTADKNIPSHEVIENLKRLCWWLDPSVCHVRQRFIALM